MLSSEADIAARLGKLNPLPKTAGATGGRGQGASNQNNNNGGRNSNSNNSNNNNSNRHQQSSKPREKKKPHVKTAEELDAEMDTYMGDVSLPFMMAAELIVFVCRHQLLNRKLLRFVPLIFSCE